jgi:alpha-L-rhamnosidase
MIRSEWKKDNGTFIMKVAVPANTSAEVFVKAADRDKITEGGRPAANSEDIKFLRMDKEYAVFEVGSGNYEFAVNE